ncbi:WD40 repeat domain-containing protein [Panacagrimonas sp.]|uniref:WD40 repeat domain-containing protein n=1 Tax=Panacagrimonas sp. TaxID=2480088 RepID=UPI003B525621
MSALTSTAAGLSPIWEVQLAEHPVALCVARDGTRVVAGGLGGELLSLDAASGQLRARWNAHPSGLCCAAFGAGVLASGGQDGCLRLWNADGVSAAETRIDGRWLEQLGWSVDGAHLAAAAGRTVVLCNASGVERHRYIHASPVRALAFSANGGFLAVGGGGGVSLLRTRDGQLDRRYDNRSPLLSLAFSPDGRILASGTGDNEVRFWRLGSGESSQMSGFKGPPFRPMALAWNGHTLASGGDQSIALWKFSGKGPEGRQPEMLHGHWGLVTHLQYSADGAWLASSGRDGTLMLTEVARPAAPRLGAELEDEACALAWHPRKPLVYVADASGRVAAYAAHR